MNVLDHMGLVRYAAQMVLSRVPANVERDDLVQSGTIGLLDAANRFDDSQGASFSTFAARRIRGAMLDELRRGDYLTRNARRRQRATAVAVSRLEQRLGRRPTDGEVAAEIGVSLDEFRRDPLTTHVSLDDDTDDRAPDPADVGGDPLDALQHKQRMAALSAQVARLPEREQYAIRMRYEHDLSLADIAATLGVTDARVHQLIQQGISKLRLRMTAY